MTASSTIEDRLRDTFDAVATTTQIDIAIPVGPTRRGPVLRPFLIGFATVAVVVTLLFALARAGGSDSSINHPLAPSRTPIGPPPGGMTDEATTECHPGGDWTKVPIGISVILNHPGGPAQGFIPRNIPCAERSPAQSREPEPVYARDMLTLIGHMYANRGFVPEGTNPRSIPCVAATAITAAPDGTITKEAIGCDPPYDASPPVSVTSRPGSEPPMTGTVKKSEIKTAFNAALRCMADAGLVVRDSRLTIKRETFRFDSNWITPLRT